jgi:hypothetical protein
MAFWFMQDGALQRAAHPPTGLKPLIGNGHLLLPPLIGTLHYSFQAWEQAGLSPGPLAPDRVWVDARGGLAFHFTDQTHPQPLLHIGVAPDLAAWLVLLDKWMETFVVVARARTVWGVPTLGGALSFLTPAFLPQALLHQPPDNWERVAVALAQAVADGTLRGASQERHWQERLA